MNKIVEYYKKIDRKSEWFQPVFILSLCLIFTFGLMASIQSVMGENTTSIVLNEAEGYYYEGKYDEAIAGYTELQKTEEWPVWKLKIAEIYSVKGEFEKSNNLLKEVIIKRNKLIQNSKEKYLEEDKKLINDVVFTFFMNKQYDQAMSLGEDYLINNEKYKPLMRTMFAVYMINGQDEKAKFLVNDYKVDEESAYDIALLAKMQLMVGKSNEGYKTLEKAWNINNNEIKTFDVITQMAAYDRENVLLNLNDLLKANPDSTSYKMFIAKVYSMVPETAKVAEELLMGIKNEADKSINYQVMMSQIYKNTNREKEANKIIDEIISSKESSYIGYHISAWQEFKEGKYDNAFESCKKSILINKNYPDNYGFLIPEIMIAWGQSQTVEPYLRTALSKEPFNFNIMVKIAEYYGYSAKKYDKAIEYYNLASTIKPNDAEILYNIGSMLVINDKAEEAVEYFVKAVSINNTIGKYYRSLGTVALNIDKNEIAIEAFRNAYALDESDVLALNNIACYYISIEGDVWRGYENMKAAYEEMSSNLDDESKTIITENFKRTEKLFNEFVNEEGKELTVPEFQLFY